MKLSEVIHSAWKSLASNKLRSLLTMLGVIIGVAAVIVMISISAGTEATIAEKINGLGSNLLFINASIQRGGPNQGPQNQKGGLVYSDVTAIRDQISGVAGVSVEQLVRMRAWAICFSLLSAWWDTQENGAGGEYSLAWTRIFSKTRV